MINPHTSYIFSLIMAVGLYQFGWSSLYPSLSRSLLIFLTFTGLFNGALALLWNRKSQVLIKPTESFFNPVMVTIFLYSLWSVDFIYEGGIPLIKILLHQEYNYRLFGVPSLHVFIVTFSSFFTVYLFSLYVSTKERLYLVLYVINVVSAILIYSRAMIIFNIVGSVFVYLLCAPQITWKKITAFAVCFSVVIYLFGVLGNIRVSSEARKDYDPKLFLDLGEATPAFLASGLPAEFFWAYIYLSSPLANLQYNVDKSAVPPFTASRLFQHINNEMVFDFISKRVNRFWGVKRQTENVLPYKPFNVSTVYSRSFSYQGWPGMALMAVFILLLPWLYRAMLPANPYSLAGLAIMNTIFLFLMYDNMIRFTGLGLQLVYPFCLPLAERTIKWLQRI